MSDWTKYIYFRALDTTWSVLVENDILVLRLFTQCPRWMIRCLWVHHDDLVDRERAEEAFRALGRLPPLTAPTPYCTGEP